MAGITHFEAHLRRLRVWCSHLSSSLFHTLLFYSAWFLSLFLFSCLPLFFSLIMCFPSDPYFWVSLSCAACPVPTWTLLLHKMKTTSLTKLLFTTSCFCLRLWRVRCSYSEVMWGLKELRALYSDMGQGGIWSSVKVCIDPIDFTKPFSVFLTGLELVVLSGLSWGSGEWNFAVFHENHWGFSL